MVGRLNALLQRLRKISFRGPIAAIIGLAGVAVYASVVDRTYAISTWLFWPLCALWLWAALFSLSCVTFGHFILKRALRLSLPAVETVVQSMTIGVVSFVMFMYLGGALHLYGSVFALVLPALMLAAGARDAPVLYKALRSELTDAYSRKPLLALVSVFGVLCAGILYLGLLTPESINYDSAWYHAVVPQDYAREGRIVPLPSNYNMAVPHLQGLIHTWSYTVPGLSEPLRWMMILHMEFSLFLWTLVSVSAGVRRLVGDQGLRGSWTAFFLFPSLFVYDHNIGGAADHVAAFFSVPMLLALLELCATFSAGSAALFAIATAGCALTKYQAVYLIVPMGGILASSWLVRLIRTRRNKELGESERKAAWQKLWQAPVIVVGLGTLLVSPHFLKNAIFYGNPVYPFAQGLFTSSWPVAANDAVLIQYIFTDDNWKPHGSFFQKVVHALRLVFTFSFDPHYSFTKNVPFFGSLFTLLMPAVLVIRDRLQIAIAYAVGLGALFIWGFTYNVDRNLQVFLPILVCATAALIVRLWRLGWVARAGIVPLVALQIVWGGDALFYSSHERIRSALDLIRSGYEGRADKRFDGYRSVYLQIGKALPKDARVLLHSSHPSLGINRTIILDWSGFQSYVSYEGLHTERELFDHYQKRGITHILYQPRERGAPSKQEEVLFYALVTRHAREVGRFGSYRLLAMPTTPPPAESPYRVAAYGLGAYRDGVYPIQAMNTNEYLPPKYRKYAKPELKGKAAQDELAGVAAVFVGNGARLTEATSALLRTRFRLAIEYPGYYSLHLAKGD